MGITISKYEKIELLVCIYENSRELVFIYGISGCFSMSDTGNHSESYSPKPSKPRNIDPHNNVIFPVIKL